MEAFGSVKRSSVQAGTDAGETEQQAEVFEVQDYLLLVVEGFRSVMHARLEAFADQPPVRLSSLSSAHLGAVVRLRCSLLCVGSTACRESRPSNSPEPANATCGYPSERAGYATPGGRCSSDTVDDINPAVSQLRNIVTILPVV